MTFTENHYAYDGDKLVSYNGEEFVYNARYAPTKYRGKTVGWNDTKHMTSFDGNTFKYDGMGKRKQKNTITYGF